LWPPRRDFLFASDLYFKRKQLPLLSYGLRSRALIFYTLVLSLLLTCAVRTGAQAGGSFGEAEGDPIKLFERGQDLHARGDFQHALEFYEEAIKLRPEFPEAEFQRGNALVSLNRPAEAARAFRRAVELRQSWPLPMVALATLYTRDKRDKEAEPLLRRALELDAKNFMALDALASLRLRANDAREALELARRATADKSAPASSWATRGMVERHLGDQAAATSLERALQIDPNDLQALEERAELRASEGDFARAIEDLKAALRVKPLEINAAIRLVRFYEIAGRSDEARRLRESLGSVKIPDEADKGTSPVIGTPAEIAAANSSDAEASRAALEKLLERNPRNASLLSRLGQSYRTTDPQRSLDFYHRAATLEPRNADYATGYAAALVKARRFAEAVAILRQVVEVAPDNYPAHANLATALYELKNYPLAITEFHWLAATRPEVAATYYFIATAHDFLGEYTDALAAYEEFLKRADTQTNQLEIEKVNLRLPSVRRLIALKQGVKRKKS
jgi:tetratricopeptide (TPR) repeat protein